jgi:hypothetical protein
MERLDFRSTFAVPSACSLQITRVAPDSATGWHERRFRFSRIAAFQRHQRCATIDGGKGEVVAMGL